MDWPSFIMGFGLASALAAFAWILAATVRDLRAEDAAIAARNPEPIARALEEVAAVSSRAHADRCRRLAAVLREPGLGEARRG